MDVVRAMTWNTWWRFGGNWREREPGIRALVREVRPDLLGIQECWGTDTETQADVLARELGGHAGFVPVGLPPAPDPAEYAEQEGVVMGLGLVSRWPLAAVRAEPMPSRGRDLSALVGIVRHPRGPLAVVVGATSWEPDRRDETTAQVEALERLTLGGAGELPAFLLADLNADETLPAVRDLRLADGWDAAPEDADPRTLGSTNRFAPREAAAQYDRRIDHVRFAPGRSGARATAAWVVRDEPDGFPPSDHYAVVVDVEF